MNYGAIIKAAMGAMGSMGGSSGGAGGMMGGMMGGGGASAAGGGGGGMGKIGGGKGASKSDEKAIPSTQAGGSFPKPSGGGLQTREQRNWQISGS